MDEEIEVLDETVTNNNIQEEIKEEETKEEKKVVKLDNKHKEEKIKLQKVEKEFIIEDKKYNLIVPENYIMGDKILVTEENRKGELETKLVSHLIFVIIGIIQNVDTNEDLKKSIGFEENNNISTNDCICGHLNASYAIL